MIGYFIQASEAILKRGHQHHEKITTLLSTLAKSSNAFGTASDSTIPRCLARSLHTAPMRHTHGFAALSPRTCLAMQPIRHATLTPLAAWTRFLHSSTRKSKAIGLAAEGSRLANDIPPLLLPGNAKSRLAPSQTVQKHVSIVSCALPTTAKKTPSARKKALGRQRPDSLEAFVADAKARGVDPNCNVYRGTRFEYVAQEALKTLGFDLLHKGGGGDKGIDLLGTWTLPNTAGSQQILPPPSPLHVIVQCKSHTRVLGPGFVRELEGAVASAPSKYRNKNTIVVLISSREMGNGVRDYMENSTRGIIFMQMPEQAHGTRGSFKQIFWNDRATQLGLEGYGITERHNWNPTLNIMEKDVAMTFMGLPVDDSPTASNVSNLSPFMKMKRTPKVLDAKTSPQGPLPASIKIRKRVGRPKKLTTGP